MSCAQAYIHPRRSHSIVVACSRCSAGVCSGAAARVHAPNPCCCAGTSQITDNTLCTSLANDGGARLARCTRRRRRIRIGVPNGRVGCDGDLVGIRSARRGRVTRRGWWCHHAGQSIGLVIPGSGGLIRQKSGNVFPVGILLDFVSSPTRTPPMGRTCR